jgi:hypothetical protein
MNAGQYIQLPSSTGVMSSNFGATSNGNIFIGTPASSVDQNLRGNWRWDGDLYTGDNIFPGSAADSCFRIRGDSWTLRQKSTLNATSTSFIQYFGSTPTSVLQFLRNGGIQNVTGTISAISDAMTKSDVTDATPKLADLMRLRVVNYTSTIMPEAGKLLGFVAQEVEAVFPSMVEHNMIEDDEGNVIGEGPLAVKWSVLVPALVKGIQELTARVEALEGAAS